MALINHGLATDARAAVPGPPYQVVERIYWEVSVTALARIVDIVRTILVELVAEMRAGTILEGGLPSREVAEQAVDVAIHGNRNRVVINQVAPNGHGTVTGAASSGGSPPETGPKTALAWAVGVATVVSAAAGVWALFIR